MEKGGKTLKAGPEKEAPSGKKKKIPREKKGKHGRDSKTELSFASAKVSSIWPWLLRWFFPPNGSSRSLVLH